MAIEKIIYNNNLKTPDSYTVECAGKSKTFNKGEELSIGEWLKAIWKDEFFPSEARIYYNISWDCDHVLYCGYKEDIDHEIMA